MKDAIGINERFLLTFSPLSVLQRKLKEIERMLKKIERHFVVADTVSTFFAFPTNTERG
jgi:hypothetical protein